MELEYFDIPTYMCIYKIRKYINIIIPKGTKP